MFYYSFNQVSEDFCGSFLSLFLFLKVETNKLKLKLSLITLIILLLVSLTVIIIPFVGFFIAIISSIFFLLQPISNYYPEYQPLKALIRNYITYLYKSNIISYFRIFYTFFFVREEKEFKFLIILLNSFIVIYSLASRYYYSNQIWSIPLFLLLLLGLMALYVRSAINFYIFVIGCVLADPQLHSLFIEDENPSKPFIDLSKRTTTNNFYNDIPPHRWSFARKVGLTASIITCSAACYAAYYAQLQAHYAKIQAEQAQIQAEQARIQAEQARIQAEQAVEQNAQIQQQNDLEALAQGLLTKEHFCNLQPRYCVVDRAAQLSAAMQASKNAGVPGIKSTSDSSN